MEKFEPGLYRLKVDVQSPRPDGRATPRSDWRKHRVWKAGTEFIVRRAYGVDCSIGPRNEAHWDLHAANPGNAEYDALLKCFKEGSIDEIVEFTVESVVDRTDISTREILEELLARDVVSFSVIEATARVLREREDKEREDHLKEYNLKNDQ